ncbi:MAG: acetyl-CoA carboxylase biotin carboxyl carrier protein [Helicobacter sp.]|nr:acetyl-CoA carboxylase biotin carboxyl carrier protein [Helicobacter sp.]
MDFKEIKELIKIFDESGLSTLSITRQNAKIKLEKKALGQAVLESPAPTPYAALENSLPSTPIESSVVASSPTTSGESINSPMVGTFYRCPSPDTPAYVNVGDKVKRGQTLAIIEAMKIMNEIEADFDCIIKEIIPNDAQPVEYNSPLFIVEKL